MYVYVCYKTLYENIGNMHVLYVLEENLQCKNVNKKGRANQENLYVK